MESFNISVNKFFAPEDIIEYKLNNYSFNSKFFDPIAEYGKPPLYCAGHIGKTGSGKSTISTIIHHIIGDTKIRDLIAQNKLFPVNGGAKGYTKGVSGSISTLNPHGVFVNIDSEGFSSGTTDKGKEEEVRRNVFFVLLVCNVVCIHFNAVRFDTEDIKLLKILFEILLELKQQVPSLLLPTIVFLHKNCDDGFIYNIEEGPVTSEGYKKIIGEVADLSPKILDMLKIKMIAFPFPDKMKKFSKLDYSEESEYLDKVKELIDIIFKNPFLSSHGKNLHIDQYKNLCVNHWQDIQSNQFSSIKDRDDIMKYDSCKSDFQVDLLSLKKELEIMTQNNMSVKSEFSDLIKALENLSDKCKSDLKTKIQISLGQSISENKYALNHYNKILKNIESIVENEKAKYKNFLSSEKSKAEQELKNQQNLIKETEKNRSIATAVQNARNLQRIIQTDVKKCGGCGCDFKNSVCSSHKSLFYFMDGHPDKYDSVCSSGECFGVLLKYGSWNCTACNHQFMANGQF